MIKNEIEQDALFEALDTGAVEGLEEYGLVALPGCSPDWCNEQLAEHGSPLQLACTSARDVFVLLERAAGASPGYYRCVNWGETKAQAEQAKVVAYHRIYSGRLKPRQMGLSAAAIRRWPEVE